MVGSLASVSISRTFAIFPLAGTKNGLAIYRSPRSARGSLLARRNVADQLGGQAHDWELDGLVVHGGTAHNVNVDISSARLRGV
jgi:hypothetical protein